VGCSGDVICFFFCRFILCLFSNLSVDFTCRRCRSSAYPYALARRFAYLLNSCHQTVPESAGPARVLATVAALSTAVLCLPITSRLS